MIWVILAVYAGGFVAVLGSALSDGVHNGPECFAMAGSWPVAWIVVLLDYARRRRIDRSNREFLDREKRLRSGLVDNSQEIK